MNNIFEELMSGQSTLTENVSRRSRRTKKESKKRIPTDKIKVESMKIFESDDYDELDDEFATVEAPDDVDNLEDGEVVLVIDPEASTEEEIPEDAAQAMIGDEVYKCPICGANYVCDCDATTEGVEVDENGVPVECPVCGDDAEQILIGEIAPIEGAGEEDTVDPVDVEDAEDDDEVEEDEFKVDEFETPEDEEVDVEEKDEVLKDSVVRRPRRPRGRTESSKRARKEGKACSDEKCTDKNCKDKDLKEEVEDFDDTLEFTDDIVVDTPAEVSDNKKPATAIYIDIDEVKLEALMNRFLRENYKNNLRFKVTRGNYHKGVLALEYVVRSGNKNVKKGVLKFEGYTPKQRTFRLKGRDKGAFTESFSRTPAFIVECVNLRGRVIPTSLKYDFKKKVNESLYRVKGNVGNIRNESVTRTPNKRPNRNIGKRITPHNRTSR